MWQYLLYIVLVPVVILSAISAFLLIRSYRYWRVRGFPDYSPAAYWTTFFRTIFVTKSMGDVDMAIYEHFRGKKFGGVVELAVMPVLFCVDPDLFKNIFIRDFDHFVDRMNVDFGKKAEYINLMVSNLSGQQWKDVRNVMTPTFTSGKMKRIFQGVCECGDHLVEYFETKARNGEELEFKDAYGRFTMDVIASTAFGVKCNSLEDPEAIFPKMANRLMNPPPVELIAGLFFMAFPRFFEYLSMIVPLPGFEPIDFFANMVKETVSEREKSGIKGKDFLQLLLDAKKGDLQEEGESDNFLGYNASTDEKTAEKRRALSKAVLNEPLIIAQSIIFFIAGFETTANTLSFVAYELALNPDIQETLFDEVTEVLERHGGKLSYDGIMEMEYLDKIIHETLRLHSPLHKLMRTCTKDYPVPGTDMTIPKGTMVVFPSLAIHRDEKYFPNPTKFDPERFTPEEKAKRNPYVYQPFGHGPRNCLGMRFAMMEAKVGLAMTVLNFRFQPSEKTDIPMKYALAAQLIRAKNGVWLKLEKRNK